MGDNGSRLTDFSRKNAFSDDNFTIFQPISMKLEMWVDNTGFLQPGKTWKTSRNTGNR